MPFEPRRRSGGPAGRPAGGTSGDPPEVVRAVLQWQDGGGPDAFEPLYRRYRPGFRNLFLRRGFPEPEADEFAHDALWRVCEGLSRFRWESSFETWAWRIAENRAKNALRERAAAKRDARVESLEALRERRGEAEAAEPIETGREADPEKRLLREERARALREALEKLPAGMRACTELRLADMKYEEIAAALGMAVGTVRSQLFEARQRLKPILERHFGGAELE